MAEFDNEWLRRLKGTTLYQLQKRVEEMPRRRPGFLADPDLDPIIGFTIGLMSGIFGTLAIVFWIVLCNAMS